MVEIIQDWVPAFYSRIVLVEKVPGSRRPITDLSILNTYVALSKFWMETMTSVWGSGIHLKGVKSCF